MLVLEYDAQRDVLGLVMRRFGLRHGNPQLLVAADLYRRVAERRSAGVHRAASDEGFQPFARQRRHGIGKRAVEPPAGMGGRQAHIDRLMTPHSRPIWVGTAAVQSLREVKL